MAKQLDRKGKPNNPPSGQGVAYKLKRVVANRCGLCTVGLGVSMYYLEKQWIRHIHSSNPNIFRYGSEKMMVCDGCLERLEEAKNPKVYIVKQLKKYEYPVGVKKYYRREKVKKLQKPLQKTKASVV